MKFSAGLFRNALSLLCGLALGGCLPSGSGPSDEQKEPHFMEGKRRVNALDFPGAIESFEKALEANPRSASAHFELGWLFDQKAAEPATAIYHYEKYLRLRPGADNSDTVKTRVLACKQELARTVSLGPVTQTLQNEFDKLNEENKHLHDEVEQLRAYRAAHPPAPPTPPIATPSPARTLQGSGGGQPAPAGATASPANASRPTAPAAAQRTHTIKPRETPTTIARMYGVKVDALMAANPRLDARRLQVGRSLNIPAQ